MHCLEARFFSVRVRAILLQNGYVYNFCKEPVCSNYYKDSVIIEIT